MPMDISEPEDLVNLDSFCETKVADTLLDSCDARGSLVKEVNGNSECPITDTMEHEQPSQVLFRFTSVKRRRRTPRPSPSVPHLQGPTVFGIDCPQPQA